MVQPISGPIGSFESLSRVIGPTYATLWTREKYRYKQAKPFNLPLPYRLDDRRVLNQIGGFHPLWGASSTPDGMSYQRLDVAHARAYAEAYDRLSDMIGDSSSWGPTLGEYYRDGMKPAEEASEKAAGFAQKLRRKHGASKALGSAWLATHFVWVPLMQDIYNTFELLTSEPPVGVKIEGAATRSDSFDESRDYPDAREFWYFRGSGFARVKLGCKITISNPNLFLLNQLGLVNPGSVAWELVPYSFIVDWFFNASSFISSFTDFWGLDVSDSYETDYRKIESSKVIHYFGDPNDLRPGYHDDGILKGGNYSNTFMERKTGVIFRPPIVFKWKKMSPTRAATAIGLLTKYL